MGITSADPDYAALRDAFLTYYAQCLAQTTRLLMMSNRC